MHKKYKRKHFFIKKPLQLRYMFYILTTLIIVLIVTLLSAYCGIWGGILKELSGESVRKDITTAVRIKDYEAARAPQKEPELQSLRFFKETNLLSAQQRDACNRILKSTNKELAIKIAILLVFIGWGSIFLSHKIAGPLYRFEYSFKEVAKGKLTTRVRLRKFDEARELIPVFNEMIESLDQTMGRIKRSVREARDLETLKNELRDELDKYETTGEN